MTEGLADGNGGRAVRATGESPAPLTPYTVHLLMVHGVGRHDRLSSLLQVYQAFRSNLTSQEAPVSYEDRIPDWRVVEFAEGASPPFLRLEPRFDPQPGGVKAVNLYEVNYSSLAGVVRQNHRLDLTTLFVGFDLAVCASRQHLPRGTSSALGGGTDGLARCLQRFSGVLAAATVPILGLPSLVLRNYAGGFVSTFTRFFEDVATFALDKNGEQLISAHLDHTVSNIVGPPRPGGLLERMPGDRFVIAAHSLGSVVAHNFIVRHWSTDGHKVPDTVVTFGSPIGLLAWAWLFLDFPSLRFDPSLPAGDRYFCWNPVGHDGRPRRSLSWINVVNTLDPIATAFPDAAVDLAATSVELRDALRGGGVAHKYFGPAKIGAVGTSHTEYLNDRLGFVEILLRAAGLRPGNPWDVPSTNAPDAKWTHARSVLGRLQVLLWLLAMAFIAAYCALVANWAGHWPTMWSALLFLWPAATIGWLAFFQRLFFGGPTKRIPDERLGGLKWFDRVSFPYRLRRASARLLGLPRDVNPLAPGPGAVARWLLSVVSFLPTGVAMAVPVAVASAVAGASPWGILSPARIVGLLACFMAHIICAAGFELAATWRRTLVALAGDGPGAAARPTTSPRPDSSNTPTLRRRARSRRR